MVTAPVLNLPSSHPSAGGRLVAVSGLELPLTSSLLEIDAGAGIARTILTQRFENHHDAALEVTYLLPLPVAGAVSGFSFTFGDQRVTGEVDGRQRAKARYEAAIASGRTAALLEQDRANLFTQKVGNIPARQTVTVEITIDQKLTWLSEGEWEFRFPTVVGPRYQGAAGRVQDAPKLSVPVADRKVESTLSVQMRVSDALATHRTAESPSHPIRAERNGDGDVISLDPRAPARLDRDVVIRWPVAQPDVGVSLDVCRPADPSHGASAFGLVTLVPPTPDATLSSVPRDLIVLLDVSGSMSGRPLTQAKRLVGAMIETLSAEDQIELIAFASRPERFATEPVVASRDGKKSALKWLRGLRAGGATEMRAAIIEALRPLRPGAHRQVVLVTDGYIGFEREIVETVMLQMPSASRLHTIGVGSAVNRAITRPAARAGGGIEIVLGLDEDVERAVTRLLERTSAPAVTELVVSGDAVQATAPVRLADVYRGAPCLASIELRPEGGELSIQGQTPDGRFERRIAVPATKLGAGQQAVAALYGREWVEDLETRLAAGAQRTEIDAEIERIGIRFQISTRLTSWVAVSEAVTNDPDADRLEEEMPHNLPYGMSVTGLGLRPSGAFAQQSERTMTGVLGRRMRGSKPRPAQRMPAPPPARPAPPKDKLSFEELPDASRSLSIDDAEDLDFDDVSLEAGDEITDGVGGVAFEDDVDALAAMGEAELELFEEARSAVLANAPSEAEAAGVAEPTPAAGSRPESAPGAQPASAPAPEDRALAPRKQKKAVDPSQPEPMASVAPASLEAEPKRDEAKALKKKRSTTLLVAIAILLGFFALALLLWLLG